MFFFSLSRFVQKYVNLWILCSFDKLEICRWVRLQEWLLFSSATTREMGGRKLSGIACFSWSCHEEESIGHERKTVSFLSFCQPWEKMSAVEPGRTFFFKHACITELALTLVILMKCCTVAFVHMLFFSKELLGELTMLLRCISIVTDPYSLAECGSFRIPLVCSHCCLRQSYISAWTLVRTCSCAVAMSSK